MFCGKKKNYQEQSERLLENNLEYGISSFQWKEGENLRKKRTLILIIVLLFVLFVAEASRGLVISSLYLYLQSVSATQTLLIHNLYSVEQIQNL